MKTIIKRLSLSKTLPFLVVGIILCALVPNSAPASAGQATNETRTVYVNGVGQVSVEPDMAIINVGVETEAKTSAEAQSKNKKQVQNIINALKEMGIDEDNIKTTWYNINPRYDYRDNGNKVLMGYYANHTLEVKINDLGQVSAVLDELTEKGVSSINNVQYTLENKESAYNQARKEAAKNAREKAEKLASIFDFRLGGVFQVQEISSDYAYYDSSAMYGKGGVIMEGNTILPGDVEVSVNLNVSYEII